MGGHHQEMPRVPDWKSYHVEDVPELKAVQKALASHGLKDPWLRNEVWRYKEFIHPYPFGQQFFKIAFCGFKYGLVAALITTAIEKAFFSGGHGHEEHGGAHH